MVEWPFILKVMQLLGYSAQFIQWIFYGFSVLVNGSPHDRFRPSRGIRQGDPVSLWFFILCSEDLTRILMMVKKQDLIPGQHHQCLTWCLRTLWTFSWGLIRRKSATFWSAYANMRAGQVRKSTYINRGFFIHQALIDQWEGLYLIFLVWMELIKMPNAWVFLCFFTRGKNDGLFTRWSSVQTSKVGNKGYCHGDGEQL